MAAVLSVAAVALMPWPSPQPVTPWPPEPPGLYLTVYDWSLGGLNCDGDCSTTALTMTGPELYGWTAACPSAWLGRRTTTVVTIWGVEWWCIDAFGSPANRVMTEIDGRRVYRIDLAFRPAAEHPWNQEYVPRADWSREWRPMAEFEALRVQRAAALAAARTQAGDG